MSYVCYKFYVHLLLIWNILEGNPEFEANVTKLQNDVKMEKKWAKELQAEQKLIDGEVQVKSSQMMKSKDEVRKMKEKLNLLRHGKLATLDKPTDSDERVALLRK